MKTLKSKSIVALFIALVACLTMVFALSFRPASADVVEPDKDLFTMEKGASVALTQDGLRFRVQMGENVYAKIVTEDTDSEVSLSVLVAPKTLFDAVSGGAYLNLSKSVKIEIEDESKIYLYDGYYWANAVLTNLNADNNAAITESQFDLSFAAIGVIEQDGVAPVYATFADNDIANNTRNQYDVLTSAVLDVENVEQATALLDSESPYASWFGGEEYPIVIDTVEEYNALTAQVTNGVNFTANIEVQNKFDIPEDNTVELPATAKKINYVSFYNDAELLETVEVVDGESAVCSIAVPAYKALEAMNGGYVRGYRNGGWVANDGSALDLSAVYANVEAKINWVWGQQETYLQADAMREEPNTVFNWDREIGVTQVHGGEGSAFERSFDTTVKLAGQNGTTKLAFTNAENADSVYFGYNLLTTDYDSTKYVAFDVYVDFADTVHAVWIRLGTTPGAMIQNKTWGTVILPISELSEEGYFMVNLRDTGNNGVIGAAGSLYLSEGKLMSADEITVLSTGYTTHVNEFTLGDFTFVPGIDGDNPYWFYQWRNTPNDGIFKQSFDQGLALIDGKLFYNYYTASNGYNIPLMAFKTAQTGVIYFTARGFIDGESDLLIFNESLSHLDTPAMNYVGDMQDGYKVYSVDLGSTPIKQFRLRVDIKSSHQVWISDISATNPLA